MKQPSFLVLLMAASLLALPSHATVVLSNIADYTAVNNASNATDQPLSKNGDTQGGFAEIASSFKTGGSSSTVNSVSLLLDASSGITLTSQPLLVSIYSDSTGSSPQAYFYNPFTLTTATTSTSHPGSSIGDSTTTTLKPNPTVTTPATFTWNFNSLSLNANTTYWIVLSSTDAAGYYQPITDQTGVNKNSTPSTFTTNGSGWTVESSHTVGDLATYSLPGNSSGNTANAWTTTSVQPLFFSIDATLTGAPEPSRALLTLLGCVGILSRRRRAIAA